MAVVNVAEKWSGRLAGFDDTGEIWTAGWTVQLDGADPPAQAARIAATATGIPKRGDSASFNVWLVARRIESRPLSPILFEVTVQYQQIQPGQGQPPDPSADPTLLPPDIEYGEDIFTEPVDEDINGDAITNSSFEPFDPPLQRSFSDTVVIVQRNTTAFDITAYQPLKWHRNNANVTIDGVVYATGTLLLRSATAQRILVGTGKYYRIRLEFLARLDEHERRVLDQGFREWVASETDGTPIFENIVDDDGNPVSAPALLDGTGGKLKSGPPANDPAVYLTFDLYPLANFSSLPLSG